ncbi:MAG: sensor domain-containing diguanylate cyclase, partial [Halanaerobiales bacterium]
EVRFKGYALNEEEIKKVISNKKDKFEFEYPDYCLETTNWFKLVATPFDQGALILHENITDRKKTQEDLKLKEKQYRTVFNQAPIGIILEDPNGKILEVNKTLTEMTGYSKQELEGKNIFDHLVAKERVGEAKEDIKIILNGQDLEFNLDNIDKKGNHYYTHFKETRIELPNHGTGILSMQVDLTNLRKKQRQLEYLSYHDELTGLYNRAFFNEEINRLDTKREIPLSIIVADVNGLKLVNDTYGHSIGDKLIIETAKLLKSNLRSEDILARFGGDEFAIILSQTSEKEAEK